MKHIFVLMPVLLAVVGLRAADAHAGLLMQADEFQPGQPVAVSELAGLRGGFADPSGVIYRFAVDVISHIDGTLTFVRSLLMEPDGNGQLQTSQSHDLQTEPLPAGATALVINDGSGVLFSNGKGQQTILLNTADNGLPTSAIFNSISGLNASQTVTVDIVLQNMQGILNNIELSQIQDVQQGVMQGLHDTQMMTGF